MGFKNGMKPVHPGEILQDEIDAADISADELADALDVPLSRVTMILDGKQGITADAARRLARFYGTTPELWLNLQLAWELRRAKVDAGRQIEQGVTSGQSAL